MKIWIDITNSPHVNFFYRMIEELKRDHQLIVTCRPLANTIELLDLFGIEYRVIGKHYGKNIFRKVAGLIIRIAELVRFLRKEDVDVSVSHSSFYSPIVSRLIGSRCIYLNDNEHAVGNWIAFLFADRVMVPEYLKAERFCPIGWLKGKISNFPGVKEGVYLSNYASADGGEIEFPGQQLRKRVFIRPEPWSAQYYSGDTNFLDGLILSLKEIFNVVVLPRGEVQKNYYRQARFDGIFVPDGSIGLRAIMENCDLFIGAGGTMTREAAVLGIPTISTYQGELLDVDRYLINEGWMVHEKFVDLEFVLKFLGERTRGVPSKDLLERGRRAYREIFDEIVFG